MNLIIRKLIDPMPGKRSVIKLFETAIRRERFMYGLWNVVDILAFKLERGMENR